MADTAFMHAGVDPTTSEIGLEDVNAKVKDEIGRFDAYVRMLVDRKLALPFFSLQEVVDVTVNELKIAIEKQSADKAGRQAPSPTIDDQRWFAEAAAVADITKWAILAPEGPMWFRGYATWPETNGPLITTLLQHFRADRIVVAHTPQPRGPSCHASTTGCSSSTRACWQAFTRAALQHSKSRARGSRRSIRRMRPCSSNPRSASFP